MAEQQVATVGERDQVRVRHLESDRFGHLEGIDPVNPCMHHQRRRLNRRKIGCPS